MGMKATFQIWIFRVGNNRKLLCAGCFKCSFANKMGLNSLWSKYRLIWMRAWTTGHMVDRQISRKVQSLIVITQWYFRKDFNPLLLVALFATFPSGVLVWTGFGRPLQKICIHLDIENNRHIKCNNLSETIIGYIHGKKWAHSWDLQCKFLTATQY